MVRGVLFFVQGYGFLWLEVWLLLVRMQLSVVRGMASVVRGVVFCG